MLGGLLPLLDAGALRIVTRSEPPRNIRPWYLIAAMCLTWLSGAFGATSACGDLSYLRGAAPPPELKNEPDASTHPFVRTAIVRERARLEAIGAAHARAFPLGVARALLGLLLVLASATALSGRRHGRSFALQVIAASALLATLDHALMAPVQDVVRQAVTADAMEQAAKVGELDAEATAEMYTSAQIWAERLRLMLVVAVYGGAALALTRRRTRDFFEARRAVVDGSP